MIKGRQYVVEAEGVDADVKGEYIKYEKRCEIYLTLNIFFCM